MSEIDLSTEAIERLALKMKAGSRRGTACWRSADVLRLLADQRDWLRAQLEIAKARKDASNG